MRVREPRQRPLTRIFFALGTVIFASYLATASDDVPHLRACADFTASAPTNFDYLVLASFADSPRFLAMAGYHSTVRQRTNFLPGVEPTPHGETVYPPGAVPMVTGPNCITALLLSSLK
jgi:hypothetical protein